MPTDLRRQRDARAAAAIAMLAATGVLLQLVLSLRLSAANGHGIGHGLVVFLGYFTVLTNLLVAVVFARRALTPVAHVGAGSAEAWRQATTTAIAMVGLVYHLLLRDLWQPAGAQWWADMALHYAVPVAVVLHWVVFPPTRALPHTMVAWACAWPLAYCVYAFVRGAWLGSYPYPFIDVGVLGYAQAIRNAAGMALAFLAAGAIVHALGRAASARR